MQVGKRVVFALTLLVFALSWIAPRWPLEQGLHSSLTVVGLIWLLLHDRRWPMSVSDFALVCGFIALHCVGARWLYSNVPYEQWFQALLGWSPAAAFGWQRNHFDRLIHLLYGLCFAPAVFAWLRQRWPLDARQGFAIMLMLIMCSSLVYEWLEWAIALGLSPEAAESYNGQQGDIWDAHADMLLATLGAAFTWLWLRREPAPQVRA